MFIWKTKNDIHINDYWDDIKYENMIYNNEKCYCNFKKQL